MLATAAAGDEFPRTGQVAALNPQEPGGQILLAQNQAPEFAYSTGPFGVFATGLGQFGSRDLTTSENGYSFNNAGFVAGADYRFTPQLVAGLAFGYTQIEHLFRHQRRERARSIPARQFIARATSMPLMRLRMRSI